MKRYLAACVAAAATVFLSSSLHAATTVFSNADLEIYLDKNTFPNGLNEEMIRQLKKLFSQIARPDPPFVNKPPLQLSYVEPLLVAEIAYSEVTEGGTLRQPSIKGLRTDIVASEVTWDEEIAARFAPRSLP